MPFLRVREGKIIKTSQETALMLGYKKEQLINQQMECLVVSA